MTDMEAALGNAATVKQRRIDVVILNAMRVLLTATVWVSAGIFGLYILAFYAAAWAGGNMTKWNGILPDLYDPNTLTATTSIGIHFAAGGIILILGSLQLITPLRRRFPAFHRWVGRLYIVSSVAAAIGGLIFIYIKGTVGGTVMDIGFTLYGILMLVAALATYRYAVTGKFDQHRAWALRLYALAIGSWLYRMDYGFWSAITGNIGHLDNFHGPFDKFMAFFFYLPNLAVVEVIIRAKGNKSSPWTNMASSVLLLGVIAFLWLATYEFTRRLWGPPILEWIGQ